VTLTLFKKVVHPQMKNQMEMIGACEAEIAELKARVSKTEEGQIALGESQLELSE